MLSLRDELAAARSAPAPPREISVAGTLGCLDQQMDRLRMGLLDFIWIMH